MDMEERQAAAAIILYGNNTEVKKQLIKKFKIKYLYWDVNWFSSEFQVQNNQIVGIYDPLILIDDGEGNEIQLDENGVIYEKLNYWLDPSGRGDKYKKMDLFLITYNNYRNSPQPWKEDLNELMSEVWSYDMNENKVAILYKIQNE